MKEKISILHSCPQIYRNYSFNQLLKNHLFYLEKKFDLTEENLLNELNNVEKITFENLEVEFIPSRTAINNLNFISNRDNQYLKTLKVQDELLLELIKIIYILLKENYKVISKEEIMINLYENILKKYGIDNISIYKF